MVGPSTDLSSEQEIPQGKLLQRVKLAGGHITSDADAEEFLEKIHGFLSKIQRGEVKSSPWRKIRGEQDSLYEETGGRISFGGPEKMFLDFIQGCQIASDSPPSM